MYNVYSMSISYICLPYSILCESTPDCIPICSVILHVEYGNKALLLLLLNWSAELFYENLNILNYVLITGDGNMVSFALHCTLLFTRLLGILIMAQCHQSMSVGTALFKLYCPVLVFRNLFCCFARHGLVFHNLVWCFAIGDDVLCRC